MTLIGALDRVRADDGPRFLVKGGVSIELRLGVQARSVQDEIGRLLDRDSDLPGVEVGELLGRRALDVHEHRGGGIGDHVAVAQDPLEGACAPSRMYWSCWWQLARMEISRAGTTPSWSSGRGSASLSPRVRSVAVRSVVLPLG